MGCCFEVWESLRISVDWRWCCVLYWAAVNDDGWWWHFALFLDKVCVFVENVARVVSGSFFWAPGVICTRLLYGISSWYHFRTSSHTLVPYLYLSISLLYIWSICTFFCLFVTGPLWFAIKEKVKKLDPRLPQVSTVPSTLLHHPGILLLSYYYR